MLLRLFENFDKTVSKIFWLIRPDSFKIPQISGWTVSDFCWTYIHPCSKYCLKGEATVLTWAPSTTRVRSEKVDSLRNTAEEEPMFLGGFFSQKDSFKKRFLNLEYSCHRRTRASSSDMTDMQQHRALLLSLQFSLLMFKAAW